MIHSILIMAVRKISLDKMKYAIFGNGENSSGRCKRGIRIMKMILVSCFD